MSRAPSLKFTSTPKGWLVHIPASLSDTGKLRRRYFKTRDKAKEECQRLREINDGTRAKAVDISADLAAEAVRVAEKLKPFGVSISQAAKFYTDHHDRKAKAPTLAAAWKDAMDHRANHRARTVSDYKSWQKALPDWFMKTNVLDITPANIKEALDEVTAGATRWKSGMRYISAVLSDQVKARTISENPVKQMMVKRNKETEDECLIYSVDELKALFAACRDYTEKGPDRLCAGCALPFAFMAFAGVRPEEITKLKWDDVSTELGNIRIGGAVAKKQYRRNVRINATLAAWIETIPVESRAGRLVPPRWRQKAARVRKEAGIDGSEKQDALRHSYGSHMLAVENDLDALKSDMGHAHMAVFFTHYHKALTKAEALPYWQVLPVGVEIPNIKIA